MGSAVTNYAKLLDAVQLIQEDNASDSTGTTMSPRTARALAGFADNH